MDNNFLKKAIITLPLLLGVICFFAFRSIEITPSQYVKYIGDVKNGLHQIKKVGDWEFDVQYNSCAYIVANELRSNDLKVNDFNEHMKNLEGLHHFNLKIGTVNREDVAKFGISSPSEEYERLYYFSFLMGKDIKLVEGNDTLSCSAFHFERTFDLSHQKSFVLAFEDKHKQEVKEKTLIIDSPIFATGPVKINFSEKNIKNIPNIKLSR